MTGGNCTKDKMRHLHGPPVREACNGQKISQMSKGYPPYYLHLSWPRAARPAWARSAFCEMGIYMMIESCRIGMLFLLTDRTAVHGDPDC